ncbi:MAG: hypothetical protein PUI53_03935 [Butyricicoccus porcorum]|nr:hypothetical protein [Butyricicoccus porcorum]
MEEKIIKSYKGLHQNMTGYGGFKYEVGKEYNQSGEICACENGFHACEVPLDVFCHYDPADSRFFEVEQSGDMDRDTDDSKIASRKIKIGAEIGIPGLVKAHVEYINSKIDNTCAATNTGNCSAATNTGDRSAATNTGDRSAATNTGDRSAATNTGYCSAATNTGDRSAATNTGDRSAATNTGYRSAATNTGNYSAATNTGYCSAATNTGYRSAASVTGRDSVAIATGRNSKVLGSIGCWLVAAEYGAFDGEDYPLLCVRTAQVDGVEIKPDTWYTLKDGVFTEADNL